jgi:hypothetical protein
MKFTLIATTFAALLATGYSETLRSTPDNNRNLDGAVPPASEVVDLAISTADEGTKRALALVVEDLVNAGADVAAGGGDVETGGKEQRALGSNTKEEGGGRSPVLWWWRNQEGLLRPVLQPLLRYHC